MWGKDWRNGFKLPGNLYLACEAQIHTFVELVLTGGIASIGKKGTLVSV